MRIDVNGVSLEVADEGSGTPVLFLHGWPDSGDLWRHQRTALTGAGFRAITPDLRGFGASDKPADVEAYALPTLFGDVIGILDDLGLDRVHVVGHDWGAALAWVTASLAPERVDRLVAMSVGNPASFGDAGLEQREKSWYMLLFQFKDVAEQWLSMDDFRNFRVFGESHPDLAAVIERMKEPGALTAGLNWYRANVPPEALFLTGPPALPPIQVPTMGLWSSEDLALTEEQMTGSKDFVTGEWRYERIDGAGHWMQLEQPDRVTELLLDFLTTGG